MKNTEERAMAFVNLYAVLGAIPRLCELDADAAALADQNVSIGFDVKGGPAATLSFGGGACRLSEGTAGCRIRLPISSCARFNGVVAGTVTPIPSRGFFKLGFLLKNFGGITNILESYLRPAPGALEDPDFFRRSTLLTRHVLVSAAAALGNTDTVARASASYIPDGSAEIAIGGEDSVWLSCRDHRLTAVFSRPDDVCAVMKFRDVHLARDIFDGRANSVACVGNGDVRIGGMIPMVDNINRIFDRVSVYLA